MPTSDPPPRYTLAFLKPAEKEWRQLDNSVRSILKQHLIKRLANPHVPGSALHGDLAHCYKIKLRAQGVRLVYQVQDHRLVVLVLSVGKREDNDAYRSATNRLKS